MSRSNVPCPRRARGGFTLVEILVVVLILGILAAMVIVTIGGMSRDASQVAFISDLRTWQDASMLYMNQVGGYPIDSSSGQFPTGMEDYIKPDQWERTTPIGGVWDMENNDNGVTFAVGVHFTSDAPPTQDDAYMTEVDSSFDDGNLASSSFRKLAADRYYLVMAD
jgi:prepilin-type N-terminal cleavage/methylation domain-containing protein